MAMVSGLMFRFSSGDSVPATGAVDGAAVVEPDVAGLLQVTLHPLAPAPVFLLLLVNSSNMSEEEVNLNFFFLPQTVFSPSSLVMSSVSPLVQALLFLMLILLQESVISSQDSPSS